MEQPDPRTGAFALHVAAAKGYVQVIKYEYITLSWSGVYLVAEGGREVVSLFNENKQSG